MKKILVKYPLRTFQFVLSILLTVLPTCSVWAGVFIGRVVNLDGKPIELVSVTIRKAGQNDVVLSGVTDETGLFRIDSSDMPLGEVVISFSHVNFQPCEMALKNDVDEDVNLSVIVLEDKDNLLNEVAVTARRNSFKSNSQVFYPTEEQKRVSGSGYDLLLKLPIPFLDVNPVTREIKTFDGKGGVAVCINGIGVGEHEIAMLDPEDIVRIDISRNPGMEFGPSISLVIDYVVKRREGFTVGTNLNDAATLVNGRNNIFAAVNGKYSELTVTQSENFTNFRKMRSDEQRIYQMSDGSAKHVSIVDEDAKQRIFNHGTNVKYNLTKPASLVFQSVFNIAVQKNPLRYEQKNVEEDAYLPYQMATDVKDEYSNLSLNLYLQKFLPRRQDIKANVVATYIGSDYNYAYSIQPNAYDYSVEGKKFSLITDLKYSKSWNSLSLSAGMINTSAFNSITYSGGFTPGETDRRNINTHAFAQLNMGYKCFTGYMALRADHQYYRFKDFKTNNFIFYPSINLNYSASNILSFTYDFQLRPVIPSQAQQTDAVIQKDLWECTVGNTGLKTFNHIENSIAMAFYKGNLYLNVRATYAHNKDAIMPIVYRTTVDGHSSFENKPVNCPRMEQLCLQTFLQYRILGSKLVAQGNGIVNYYISESADYLKHRTFFFGHVSLSSTLGRFYLSGGFSTRYNAFFAETTWYNEYENYLSATFNYRKMQAGLRWSRPLQPNGCNSRIVTDNRYVYKNAHTVSGDKGNLLTLSFIWRLHVGKKQNVQNVDIEHSDNEGGLLK